MIHWSRGDRDLLLLACIDLSIPASLHAQMTSPDEAVRATEAVDRTVAVAQLEREKAVRDVKAAETHRWPVFSVTALGSQPLQLGLTLERGCLGKPVALWIDRVRERGATSFGAA